MFVLPFWGGWGFISGRNRGVHGELGGHSPINIIGPQDKEIFRIGYKIMIIKKNQQQYFAMKGNGLFKITIITIVVVVINIISDLTITFFKVKNKNQ